MVRKEIVPLLFIVIIALVYPIWSFQTQITNNQKQAAELQNQLINYENSTNALQTRVNALEAQLNGIQNPTSNVTIENITSSSWYVPVGVAMFKTIFVTVKNIGTNDVGGLIAEFTILENGTVWNNDYYEVVMTAPSQLGVLHAQESTVIQAEIRSSIGVSFAGKTLAVTLILDKTVLDERAMPLSAGFPES